MEKLSLAKIAELSNGKCPDQATAERLVTGVATDTRELRAGELFVALKGERFNGHDFLEEAARKGVAGAMVESKEMQGRSSSVPLILVDDVLTGLQSMARQYRRSRQVQTVAVAGSNGKTGTKEMVAAVLGTQFSVLKNQGNLNNHIGVPLSLLKLNAGHQIGVFEVGTNHPGELIPLLEMVEPLAGIITVIGEEHLEYFHDLEGVAQEEGTLAEMLPKEGLLVLNADDVWSPSIARRSKARVATFGFARSAQYRAAAVGLNFSGTQFKLTTPQGNRDVVLNLLGRHQVSNALAAVAVGEFFGLDLDRICEGLESVTATKMRMERRATQEGVWIINDAYNANPSSMGAALESMKDLSVPGKRYAVLGEMLELGKVSEAAHREVGRKAVEIGVDVLVVVGEGALPMMDGAKSANRPSVRIEFFSTPEQAGEFIRSQAVRGDLVLVKGSRGATMEKTVEGWM